MTATASTEALMPTSQLSQSSPMLRATKAELKSVSAEVTKS